MSPQFQGKVGLYLARDLGRALSTEVDRNGDSIGPTAAYVTGLQGSEVEVHLCASKVSISRWTVLQAPPPPLSPWTVLAESLWGKRLWGEMFPGH